MSSRCFGTLIDSKAKKGNANIRIEYLIVVTNDDNISTLCTGRVVDKIKVLGKQLQGQLHIALINKDTCMCCNKAFNVQDILVPHVLYVLLPKENVYVQLQNWDHEYLGKGTRRHCFLLDYCIHVIL